MLGREGYYGEADALRLSHCLTGGILYPYYQADRRQLDRHLSVFGTKQRFVITVIAKIDCLKLELAANNDS